MHSFIVQVSNKPVHKEDYISEYNISECDYGCFGIDYTMETDADAVDIFSKLQLPEGFSLNKKERSVEYDGTEDWINNYKEKLCQYCSNMAKKDTDEMDMDIFLLKRAINKPYFGEILFYWENWSGGLVYPIDFLLGMCNESNRKVYIGACLDYHS